MNELDERALRRAAKGAGRAAFDELPGSRAGVNNRLKKLRRKGALALEDGTYRTTREAMERLGLDPEGAPEPERPKTDSVEDLALSPLDFRIMSVFVRFRENKLGVCDLRKNLPDTTAETLKTRLRDLRDRNVLERSEDGWYRVTEPVRRLFHMPEPKRFPEDNLDKNERRVLQSVRGGKLTVEEIRKDTLLGRNAVYRNLSKLQQKCLVRRDRDQYFPTQ